MQISCFYTTRIPSFAHIATVGSGFHQSIYTLPVSHIRTSTSSERYGARDSISHIMNIIHGCEKARLYIALRLKVYKSILAMPKELICVSSTLHPTHQYVGLHAYIPACSAECDCVYMKRVHLWLVLQLKIHGTNENKNTASKYTVLMHAIHEVQHMCIMAESGICNSYVGSLVGTTSPSIVQRTQIPHSHLSLTWQHSVRIVVGSVSEPQQHLKGRDTCIH